MTLLANSQNTYDAVGIREDLTDIVALIDPQETPFVANIGTGPASKSTKHEWQVQTLAAASTTNFQLEGDDAPSAAAATARTRLFNYCAISRKVGAVTRTDQRVRTAGIANELDNQKMLKAVELRRDQEVILLNNQAYQAGGTLTARKCAGIAAYITNADMSGTQAYTIGTGTGATAWNLAAATVRAISLTILNGSMQQAAIAGGKPNMLLLSPTQRTAFSNMTLNSSLGGAAQVRYNTNSVKPMALIGTVDTWLSNFGQVDVMCDIHMAGDTGFLNITGFLVDTKHVAISYLDPMFTEDLAKSGDNTKFEVIVEYTLQVDAPKAHAMLPALA